MTVRATGFYTGSWLEAQAPSDEELSRTGLAEVEFLFEYPKCLFHTFFFNHLLTSFKSTFWLFETKIACASPCRSFQKQKAHNLSFTQSVADRMRNVRVLT